MARTWPNNGANRLRVGANPSVLDFPGSGSQFTIAAWIKLASIPVAGNATFISKYNGTIGPLFRITDAGTKNKLSMFCIDTVLSGHDAIGATVLSTATWLHIAGTWNGSSAATNKTLACWLNGVRDGTATSPGMHTTSDTTNGWVFGARAASFPLDGDMAEMAFWDTDLSAGTSTCPELVALSRGVSPTSIRPGSLVAHWPTFNSGDNQIDLTKNRNKLELIGTLNSANHAPVGPPVPVGLGAMNRG